MTLRALTATITFTDKASTAIQAVDTSMDGVKDSLTGAQTEVTELTDEISTLADSAGNDISEVGDEVQELAEETGKVKDETEDASDSMAASWAKVGAAIGVAAAALEGFSRMQQGFIVSSQRVGYVLDMEADEIKAIAIDVQSTTMTLDEAYAVLEMGARTGVDSAEGLRDYANLWSTVSTATGEGVVELAKASVALRGVGIEVGNESEALAAFGFIQTKTTGSVTEFLTFLQRMGPELREMDMDINQSAAVLGALERELGMTSRTARMEFRTAVNESNGSLDKLLDILGLTEDQLEAYTTQVEESGDAMSDLNDIVTEAKTPIQRLTSGLQALVHQYGSELVPVFEVVSPMLGVVSAGMMIMATVQYLNLIPALKATAISVKAVTLAFLASPIGPIVIALTALIAVLTIVALNWDAIKEAVEKAWDGIKNAIGAVVDWISRLNLFETGKNIIDSLTRGIRDAITGLWDAVKDVASTITDGIKGLFGIASPSTVMMDFGVNMGEGLHIGLAKETEDFFNSDHKMTAFMEPIESSMALQGATEVETPTAMTGYDASPQKDGAATYTYGGDTVNIGDIIVHANSDNPQDIAAEIERTLRRAFGSHADRYFAKQSRSV